jgi:hypothetical protein
MPTLSASAFWKRWGCALRITNAEALGDLETVIARIEKAIIEPG